MGCRPSPFDWPRVDRKGMPHDELRGDRRTRSRARPRARTKGEIDEHLAQGWPQRDDFFSYTVHGYSRAAGCYVEVENTGTVGTFGPGIMTFDDGGTRTGSWPVPERDPTQSVRVEIPHSGQPIVLLAVGGGNQEFDHWDEAGTICVGQGARCEVAEPPADSPYALFAKAVFKKKPDDIRMETVGEELPTVGRRVFDPRPD